MAFVCLACFQEDIVAEIFQAEPSFDCMMCGHCCEGKGGIVVSNTDLERLCAHLSVSKEAFVERWGVLRANKLFIRSNGTHCIFFQQNAGCQVHSAKPDICRAWPFFRGNLVDSESLALAKDYCPGIARDVSHADFARQGISYLERAGLAGHGRPDEAAALQVEDLKHLLSCRPCANNDETID